jgi:hypothetical protein
MVDMHGVATGCAFWTSCFRAPQARDVDILFPSPTSSPAFFCVPVLGATGTPCFQTAQARRMHSTQLHSTTHTQRRTSRIKEKERERERERQIDRPTHTDTDRQTYTDRHTDTECHTQIDTYRYTHKHCIIQIDIYRYRYTHKHAYKYRQTHTQIYTNTYTYADGDLVCNPKANPANTPLPCQQQLQQALACQG